MEELTLVKDKYPILGWPIIRGGVTFLDSMVRGVKALMFSADYYPDDENTQPSKLDNGWRPTFRRKSSSRRWCGCRCFCPWG